jgi:hypothetical protein
VESFDQSLKLLLHEDPASFVRFALGDPTVRVLGPLPSGLPSRAPRRRRRLPHRLAPPPPPPPPPPPRAPVTERCTFPYGRPTKGEPGSTCVYHRVTLRALGWKDLLTQAPPSLWPLVALTRDGACDEAVHEAMNAIEGRAELSHGQRTDHLAVLWFVAEAEDVPVWIMRAYLTEERLMESTLFQRAIEKGEAKAQAEVLIQILTRRLVTRRLVTLDAAVRERIHATSDRELLSVWVNQALDLTDAEQARRFVEQIQKALAA